MCRDPDSVEWSFHPEKPHKTIINTEKETIAGSLPSDSWRRVSITSMSEGERKDESPEIRREKGTQKLFSNKTHVR